MMPRAGFAKQISSHVETEAGLFGEQNRVLKLLIIDYL
jgi:hypothetical protein